MSITFSSNYCWQGQRLSDKHVLRQIPQQMDLLITQAIDFDFTEIMHHSQLNTQLTFSTVNC